VGGEEQTLEVGDDNIGSQKVGRDGDVPKKVEKGSTSDQHDNDMVPTGCLQEGQGRALTCVLIVALSLGIIDKATLDKEI
jgi:hypothetical protein